VARRIDQQIGLDLGHPPVGIGDSKADAAVGSGTIQHPALERQHGPMGFGIALQRQHQAMAVDDAGGRRDERGDTG
jgi:hypothetical protein